MEYPYGNKPPLTADMLPWYHPTLNRHTAESMLIQNGLDGTYLLRPSTKGKGNFALSVRCAQTVKHFSIDWSSDKITFGHRDFYRPSDFVEHINNQPVLGSDAGQVVVLKTPYPNDTIEPIIYAKVNFHAEIPVDQQKPGTESQLFSINSKEGFLTKRGHIFKTWRVRWFVLQRNELKYFKDQGDKNPIRVLDLKQCKECCRDFSQKDKTSVMRLDMGWRVFLVYSVSDDDIEDWIQTINWKLGANQSRDSGSEQQELQTKDA